MSRPPPGSGPLVFVVLSSYNGTRYLADQVESIRAQSEPDWIALVRDDGSTDGTGTLLARLQAADARITRFEDGRGNLGPTQSFAALLQHAADRGARYVALADQDDIWRPDKLARQLDLLRGREAAVGPDVPLLAHSDLAVVADDLTEIHSSFLAFHRLGHVDDRPLRRLLVQNFVTGCATMVNGALLRAALPLPDVPIHDWWLALCAAAFGEILFDPDPLVRYRQHGANVLGAPGWQRVYRGSLRHPLDWWERGAEHFQSALVQAGELSRRCEDGSGRGACAGSTLELLREYCRAFERGRPRWNRLRTLRRHAIRPTSLLPVPLAFYARVLLAPGTGNWVSPGRSSARRGPSS